jgi:hypothetical protein
LYDGIYGFWLFYDVRPIRRELYRFVLRSKAVVYKVAFIETGYPLM